MANLKSLNSIAKKSDLKLIHGNGYFYWIGINEQMDSKMALLQTTSVYVFRFSDLTFKQWLEELEDIKKKIKEDDIDPNEEISFRLMDRQKLTIRQVQLLLTIFLDGDLPYYTFDKDEKRDLDVLIRQKLIIDYPLTLTVTKSGLDVVNRIQTANL